MSRKYKPMTDETTDEDVSGEDGPLAQDTEPTATRGRGREYSRLKFGRKLNLGKSKIITIIFILVTLTFAISTWVLILLFGFVFAPKFEGENEILVCNLPTDSDEIVKPFIDTRSYLYKELENGLRVLVISDPQTEISGAALSVLSGTLNEGSIDGLAHFCEHMLFLGNEKYNKTDLLFDFLGAHGGRSNAYTDLGITNYFFQVESNSFASAFDIFSNFFIKPLFTPEYVDKEINAVNSEYEYDKLVKDWRIFRLMQVVSKEDSPFRKFSIGNLDTLNISTISIDVSNYYDRFYSSNLMTAVIYGNQNATDLMDLVEPNFSGILNKNLKRNSYSYPYDNLPNIVIAHGLTKETDLVLTFQLPSFQENHKMGPSFITHLLSYSGNNSYISNLKDERLIFEIDVSVDDLVSTSLLVISMRIPNELIYNDQWSDIVTHIFSYVSQLRDIPSEDMKEIFDSWLDAQQKHFDYEHQTYDMSYFASLARQMQTINASQYFLDPPCALEYDYNFINTEILGQLIPSNLLIILYSDSFNVSGNQGWPDLALNETYFNLHYESLSPNSGLISQWEQAPFRNFSSANNLPVPTEFNLLSGSNELDPKLSLSSSRQTWHLQNTQYSLPYVKLSCLLETSDFNNSTQNAATIRLFNYILNALLPEHLDYYQNFYSFSYSYDYMSGILLSYEGYSDTNILSQFIDSTTELVTNVQSLFQDPLFDVGYGKLMDSLQSFNQSIKARDLATYYFELLFYPNSYLVEDILSALAVNDNFPSLMAELHQNTYLNCFSFGNVDDSLTKDLLDQIQNKFGSSLTSLPTLPQVTKLCPGKNYTFWQHSPIQGDSNSVIDVVFELGRVCGVDQLGDACDASLLKRWVLVKILSSVMSPMFFTQLRTEEQLGYVVYSVVRRKYDNAFLHLFIQSSIRNPDYLESRVDAFLIQFRSLIQSTDWVKLISSYNDSLVEPDSFDSAFDYLWSEIGNMQYQFSRISQIKNLLLQISREDIVSFYNSTFFGENAAPRMNIKIFANNLELEQPNNQTDLIYYETIKSFKLNLVC